jgi:hypothetical protein
MSEPTTPADLPARWRDKAERLRRDGGDAAARVWELAAVELLAALRADVDPGLSLVDAAKVSGYTADHLGELVRKGRVPNAGKPRAPRIRRADLPIKNATPAPHRRHPRPDRPARSKIADNLRGKP